MLQFLGYCIAALDADAAARRVLTTMAVRPGQRAPNGCPLSFRPCCAGRSNEPGGRSSVTRPSHARTRVAIGVCTRWR